jgi:NAD-dependent SIR2 family protein deacetylase
MISAPAPAAHASAVDASVVDIEALASELGRHRRWFVLTGAGCSTESGIPAYRDAVGAWQHKAPIQFNDFVRSDAVRRRYWARSFIGYQRLRHALPNDAHRALARFQRLGLERILVTQNVDGLHEKAGSQGVIDLHGRIASVECLGCRSCMERDELQLRLLDQNPWLSRVSGTWSAPDGDAQLDDEAYQNLDVPTCGSCAGILKPAVVFFGEAVPAQRIAAAYQALAESDALLVIGSSLMVFSGYRFVRRAADAGKPIVVINRGVTRADPLATLKVEGACSALLDGAVRSLERALFMSTRAG